MQKRDVGKVGGRGWPTWKQYSYRSETDWDPLHRRRIRLFTGAGVIHSWQQMWTRYLGVNLAGSCMWWREHLGVLFSLLLFFLFQRNRRHCYRLRVEWRRCWRFEDKGENAERLSRTEWEWKSADNCWVFLRSSWEFSGHGFKLSPDKMCAVCGRNACFLGMFTCLNEKYLTKVLFHPRLPGHYIQGRGKKQEECEELWNLGC